MITYIMFLPNELFKIIFNHFSVFDNLSFACTNTKNYKSLEKTIKNEINKTGIIQRFYRKRKPYFPFEESYMNLYFEPTKKRRLFIIRCYIALYPQLILFSYPEFLVNKTNIYNSDTKKLFLKEYLNNMPILKNRTRRDIRDFLSLDYITVRDIVYAGW